MLERVKEVLRETRSRVSRRVGEEVGESFWTGRELRQGCPLSPQLFNILTADMEEEMRKVKWGGVAIEEKRIYSLAYADDIVMLVGREEDMKSMIERLKNYLDKKGLELNVSKPKIMRFRKGGGRMTKRVWRWKEKKLEEVKEYTYLGYTLQRNGGQEAQRKTKKSSNETSVANKEKEIWKGLGKKIIVVRQADLDRVKLWSGSMGLARKRGNRKIGGKIFEMDFGGGEGNTRIYGERGGAKGEVERKSGKKSVDV